MDVLTHVSCFLYGNGLQRNITKRCHNILAIILEAIQPDGGVLRCLCVLILVAIFEFEIPCEMETPCLIRSRESKSTSACMNLFVMQIPEASCVLTGSQSVAKDLNAYPPLVQKYSTYPEGVSIAKQLR